MTRRKTQLELFRVPTIAEVERALKLPTASWVGNCFSVASQMVERGLVPGGRAVYGHWLGRVHPDSPFGRLSGRPPLPFTRHGWITRPDGQVVDPTQWTFGVDGPYVYSGLPTPPGACIYCGCSREEHEEKDDVESDYPCDDFVQWPYDEGGNELRAAQVVPMPTGSGVIDLGLTIAARQRLRVPRKMTLDQIVWLANRPYVLLGTDVHAVYDALVRAGYSALIPYDNRERSRAERVRR